ncbi:MAG: hypothetical protein SGJ20_21675 [Planctomycetota bacterium]|nr:hypothetical protein [Planctomycetota bacterium]
MLAELSTTEMAAALDKTAEEILASAGVAEPPVDAVRIASRLGIQLAWDDRQTGRARLVRFGRGTGRAERPTIFLRRDPRVERIHWAVAHELGEQWSWRVFQLLGVDPEEAAGEREQVANLLAGRLIVPTCWFAEDCADSKFDLLHLKDRYPTASHELIARRMLDRPGLRIVTVFDQGKMSWRRSSAGRRAPPLSKAERALWQQHHLHPCTDATESPPPDAKWADIEQETLRCWPIHEPDWKREILLRQIETEDFD